MELKLTVPYAGQERTISGTPAAIAKVAQIVETGLPRLEILQMSQEEADLCEEGSTTMGLGRGDGKIFISGSHVLVLAIRHAMNRNSVAASLARLTA